MAETRFAKVADEVRRLLREGRHEQLAALLAQYQPTEIAEDFDNFTPEEQLVLLAQMPTERAVDVFECLDEPLQKELLGRFGRERQVTFLREMEPDERADLFQSFPKKLFAKFLAMLPREEEREVRELVGYEPTTAGGRMTTDFAWVSPDMTVGEAIKKFRENYADLEMVYYVYVLDERRRLVGLLSIRQLLLHDPNEKIEDIMFRNVISVTPETDQEEVANILTLYDFYALPVVDESKRMLGIVTFDDVADVMSEEATEDLEKFGAVLPSDMPYERAGIMEHVRRRVPWLLGFLVLSSISGFIIVKAEQRYHSQGTFLLYGMLVALYPMLTATAGNAGSQVAAQMIRAIATGEIREADRWRVLAKEFWVSIVMGVVLGALAFVRAMMTSDRQHWWFIGTSVAGALVAMLLIANAMGAMLPLLLKRLGFDPALMSGPLIATLIDIFSAVVYFGTAAVVANVFLPIG